ncbi:MAG TPA: hypothetical protein VK098_06190 [Beutenbergiaceae bacterium]|nr:hypothetical protein [Beutenbergiaceae bacterium]
MENDAVMHSGRLFVGDDSCLYVQLDDDGSTHLAVLSPGVTVTSEELDLGRRRLVIGTDVTFGRVTVVDPVPSDALETCSGARTTYGVG